MDSDDEEDQLKTKVPKFPIQMYITEGNKYLRLAKYDTAIEFFNTALDREPTNERSLIGRSKCKMRVAKFSEAKEDAEEALKTNPNSCEAKMLIGEAEYFLGDFEKSFLTFYRGHLKRPNYEGLKFGYQMSKNAIDNALQPDKPMIINDQDVSGLSKLGHIQDNGQVSKSKTQKDMFSSDVDFMNALLTDDADSVHPHCQYLKMYLEDRQVFWRTQNPDTSKINTITADSIPKDDDENQNKAIFSESKEKQLLIGNVEQDTTPEIAAKIQDDEQNNTDSENQLLKNDSEQMSSN